MRKLLQILLRKPILWFSRKFTSNPDKERVMLALSDLYQKVLNGNTKAGIVVPIDVSSAKIIIFSDQHKGARNGADDFSVCENTYLTALKYYHKQGFTFISLGDADELWENTLSQIKKHNKKTFTAETKFFNANRFYKVFGNHDLYWANDPFAGYELKKIYGHKTPIYESVILALTINDKLLHVFCTHGHQGDKQSDGNWFSKFFVARIWAPLQAYLQINPNEPSSNNAFKTLHNEIMYAWSAQQQNCIVITGHTHQPVFESLTHLERLHRDLERASTEKNQEKIAKIKAEIIRIKNMSFDNLRYNFDKLLPYYFNTGCCCFDDGDITGIEIDDGKIKLIKWSAKNGERMVLEKTNISNLF